MTIFEMGAGERGGGGGGRNYEVVTVLHRFSLYLTRNSYGGWIFGGGGGDYEVVTVLHRFLLYLTRNSYGGCIFGGGGGGGWRKDWGARWIDVKLNHSFNFLAV